VDLARKPWATNAWKEQRVELISGKSCEWCGAKEELVVHHTHKKRQIQRRADKPIIRELIREKVDSGEINSTKIVQVFTCPECGSKQYAKGEETTTCKDCRKKVQLSTVDLRNETRPVYFLGKEGFKQFITKYAAEIEARRSVGYNVPEYTDLEEDTMILCNRCHFAIYKEMHLCPRCKSKYVPNRYGVCINCLSPKNRQAIIRRKEDWIKLEREDD
jgi:ssDNA-binding Zn-finger/Zn-ribbon topoisomerase 1